MENSDKLDKYIQLLEANKNIILTGAPGTGKTHLAKAIAKKMEAEYEFVQFHPSYDYTDFVEGLRPTPPDKNGNIGFERKDGVFKEFCKKAIIRKWNTIDSNDYKNAIKRFKNELKINFIKIKSFRSETIIHTYIDDKNIICVQNKSGQKSWSTSDNRLLNYLISKICPPNDTYLKSIGNYILDNYLQSNITITPNIGNYIFIIDEINRGEISKIFGELFFSIDPGYRGEKGLVNTISKSDYRRIRPFLRRILCSKKCLHNWNYE